MKNMSALEHAVSERLKCEDLDNGFEYFVTNYIMTNETGTGRLIHFKPWPIQKETFIRSWVDIWSNQRKCCDAGKKPDKNGIIFMASRQCGKTQLTEALCVWLMLFFPNYNIMHLNKDQTAAKKVILEIHTMIDNLPTFLRPKFKRDTKDKGFTLDNESTLMVEASKSTNKKGDSSKGRSYRPNLVWIDEAAFIDLGEHLSAIMPATSRSFLVSLQNKIPYGVIFSSTPNGRTGTGKRFYDEWMACKSGDPTNLIAIQYYWHQCPGYDNEWYKTACAIEHCTPEHPNSKVNQEFNLMFISNSNSLFADDIMTKLQDVKYAKEPIKEEKLADGVIRWFDMPSSNTGYIVGIDTATMDGADFSTVEVIDYQTEMQICEGKFKCQVKTFCNDYIPKIVEKLNQRLLVIEKNGVGNQTIEILMEKYPMQLYGDYSDPHNPKYGVHSTMKTRRLCVEQIFEMCSEHVETICSHDLRLEATSLERKSNGRIEGVPHDDLCFAIGWARYVLAHDFSFVTKYFNSKRYEHSTDSLIKIFSDVNDNVSYSNNDSDTVNNLISTYSSYSNVTSDELIHMFDTYGARSFRNNSNDDDFYVS